MKFTRVLQPFLSPKKLKKLQNNPTAFFNDAINKRAIPIKNQLKNLKPKKKHGYAEYYIISAVYNVEKYLEDYFNSILKQRLDFKNNIHIICVDDGSTDKSAQIIKSYQKQSPNNIFYLHKENGGQASARNMGLEWLQERLGDQNAESFEEYLFASQAQYDKCGSGEATKSIWITFIDPDDFLDRDYFYEVDSFLEKSQNLAQNLAMISCNLIFYYEARNTYSQTHPLRFKFQKKEEIRSIANLNNFIQLSAASAFLNFAKLPKNLRFDEECKPDFEDAKFVNEFLLENLSLKATFLKDAQYFYRKRSDGTSTLDNKLQADINPVLKLGYLLLLHAKNKSGYIPSFIQRMVIYHIYWIIALCLNKTQFSFHTTEQRAEFHKLFKEIFSLIATQNILDFTLSGFEWLHRVGILHCFKEEYPPYQVVKLEKIAHKQRQILLSYLTPYPRDVESVRVDEKEVYADIEKIMQYNFLDKVFCYEKRLWVHIPKDAKELQIFIRGKEARIFFKKEWYSKIPLLGLFEIKKKEDLWVFCDRDYEARDNAEYLYTYIANTYPNQKIIFALNKDSKDYKRLEREGFNLVEFGSKDFCAYLQKATKVISSHCDAYLTRYFPKDIEFDFIFLQHGVTKDNVSSWLNNKAIDGFLTTSKREYDSITEDFTTYKYTKKEVKLTGFARFDPLLKNNQTNTKQILIMPTWRKYLGLETQTGGYNPNLIASAVLHRSAYFQAWHSFLSSKALENLALRFNVKVVFNPHPNVALYVHYFNLPSFISINSEKPFLELFCESSLMITDYSSVAFDMGYLQKPVLYYQFDEQTFFEQHSYTKGYFDYRKDGFGPVANTEEELLKNLEEILKNHFQMGESYKLNSETAFAFRDGKCCERIYQALLEMDKPYEKHISLGYILTLANNALELQCYKEAKERFQTLLELSQDFSFKESNLAQSFREDWILNYLKCARVSGDSKNALEHLEKLKIQKQQRLSPPCIFEIVKNVLAIETKAIKENQETQKEIRETKHIKEALKALESIPLSSLTHKESLEFITLKLQITALLDKANLKEVYATLKRDFARDSKELDLELLLFIALTHYFAPPPRIILGFLFVLIQAQPKVLKTLRFQAGLQPAFSLVSAYWTPILASAPLEKSTNSVLRTKEYLQCCLIEALLKNPYLILNKGERYAS
ncbi:CDP-glycerol glycerophosphotransferase family protein [Helicobacter turcicus]|uniref:Bifunctional glycosyltransferase family 2 protein/CDP-glycerol:glycerophosphate glycerophosphotransferase n=1 Tax=Helicobacter turcicus TaxID=2867412 RepID=A0ABS7JPT5_9HELI|nr:bifunctional glycosyltransferase family 2 protein/CDP-glycerol:glycerophosphate glycerophosphotransferase [Helicobacter turcicus]